MYLSDKQRLWLFQRQNGNKGVGNSQRHRPQGKTKHFHPKNRRVYQHGNLTSAALGDSWRRAQPHPPTGSSRFALWNGSRGCARVPSSSSWFVKLFMGAVWWVWTSPFGCYILAMRSTVGPSFSHLSASTCVFQIPCVGFCLMWPSHPLVHHNHCPRGTRCNAPVFAQLVLEEHCQLVTILLTDEGIVNQFIG